MPTEGRDPVQEDPWAAWLLRRRHAGDLAQEAIVRDKVARYVEKVLDAAAPMPGERLLDLGTGDGEVAVGALGRTGPTLSLVLVDLSPTLLSRARERVAQAGAGDVSVLEASAEALVGVESESVDIVTARSVFAYVGNRRAAFEEAFRVLRPGGRLSIAEPVMRDEALASIRLRRLFEKADPEGSDPLWPLLARVRAAQYPADFAALDARAVTNYTERDLFDGVRAVGFERAALDLHVRALPQPPMAWSVALGIAPYPGAPTLGEVLADRFTAEERERYEACMRPVVEAGGMEIVDRMAYVTARKPGRGA